LTNSMKICRLHYGLFLLADKTGRVPYDPEVIRQRLFPEQTINLTHLLNLLEKSGLIVIDGDPLVIRLLPWPEVGARPTARKGERLQEPSLVAPWQGFSPAKSTSDTPLQKEKEAIKRTLTAQKTGLAGFQYSPAFLSFMKSWPYLLNRPEMRRRAWAEWEILSRSRTLPDIGVILLALQLHPPGSRTWPATWLRRKPWRLDRPQRPECPICGDEGVIYGVRENGSKGAIPCPKNCQK
jgi:hypothetical protein